MAAVISKNLVYFQFWLMQRHFLLINKCSIDVHFFILILEYSIISSITGVNFAKQCGISSWYKISWSALERLWLGGNAFQCYSTAYKHFTIHGCFICGALKNNLTWYASPQLLRMARLKRSTVFHGGLISLKPSGRWDQPCPALLNLKKKCKTAF